ncbi:hypothetical protein [Azospirillum argentinense]
MPAASHVKASKGRGGKEKGPQPGWDAALKSLGRKRTAKAVTGRIIGFDLGGW